MNTEPENPARSPALLGQVASEDGVTSTEYAILSMLIAVAIIVAVVALGGSVRSLFEQVATFWS